MRSWSSEGGRKETGEHGDVAWCERREGTEQNNSGKTFGAAMFIHLERMVRCRVGELEAEVGHWDTPNPAFLSNLLSSFQMTRGSLLV